MTKKLFFLASLIFAMASNAFVPSSDTIHNCWDGSYAYSVASVVIGNDWIEFGFKSGFDLFSSASGVVVDNSGIPVDNGRFFENKVYAAFKPSQCEIVGEVMTCNASSADFNGKDTLFVDRTPNPGDAKVITPISFSNLVVTVSPDRVLAVIEQQTADPEGASVTISFPFRYCNDDGALGNTHFGNAYFPNELKEYLKES